jgi:hypothetical protein
MDAPQPYSKARPGKEERRQTQRELARSNITGTTTHTSETDAEGTAARSVSFFIRKRQSYKKNIIFLCHFACLDMTKDGCIHNITARLLFFSNMED